MRANLVSLIARNTYKLRIALDRLIYAFMKSRNNWEILDKFRGKDVLVVGNGPSLNKTELENIDMVSIGMNKINLLFERSVWRPDIITCVNSLVIRQNRDFFNTTDIIVVLPIRAWYLGVKKRDNILFVNTFDDSNFRSDLSQGIAFVGSTVTFTALQIAAALKATSVNIVGVDHNFKNYTGERAIEQFTGDDCNHFDPNYFKDSLWGLPDLEGSEIAYAISKKYFDNNNIPITDYTIGGKCNIFVKDDVKKIYHSV